MAKHATRSGDPPVIHYDDATIELVRADAARLQHLGTTNNVISGILWSAAQNASGESRQTDTKTDTPKKIRKMTAAAAGAAKHYREQFAADPTYELKQAVSEYVDDHGGSVESIYRTLNDNPDQWRLG